MISISSLFRFIFIFTVITVALVGFIFGQSSFLLLAAINASLLFLVCLVLRFAKGSAPIIHLHKDKKVPTEEIKSDSDESTDPEEVIVSSKNASHAHHQQVVKYTYNHKKKKKGTSIVWLFALLAASAFYRFMNNSFITIDNILDTPSKTVPEASVSLSGDLLSGDVVESTGEVLSTGLSTTASTGIVVDKSFVTTGESPSSTSLEKPTLSPSTLKFTDNQSISLLESVVYLLQTRNTPLFTNKDVRFANVSTTNKYYAYWYTAYKMGLVGKTSSPSTLVSCQTYIVLKGMLEKWNVQYTSTNIKTQFWAEAQKRDLLDGCVFGKTLKGVNLD